VQHTPTSTIFTDELTPNPPPTYSPQDMPETQLTYLLATDSELLALIMVNGQSIRLQRRDLTCLHCP